MSRQQMIALLERVRTQCDEADGAMDSVGEYICDAEVANIRVDVNELISQLVRMGDWTRETLVAWRGGAA